MNDCESPDDEFRDPEDCNHHPEVEDDCVADNQRISWESL